MQDIISVYIRTIRYKVYGETHIPPFIIHEHSKWKLEYSGFLYNSALHL